MSDIFDFDDDFNDDNDFNNDNLIYYFSLWKNMFLLNRDG
jgi:hypothetical protein